MKEVKIYILEDCKYFEVCRRCGEVFETDQVQQDVVCAQCQYRDWQEQEGELEESHA